MILKPFATGPVSLSIDADIQREGSLLRLRFHVLDPENVLQDGFKPARYSEADLARSDGLWQTTCFEAFWSPRGKSPYYELNLSPSSPRWNLYRFESYRAPQPPTPSTDFELLELVVKGDGLAATLQGPPDLGALDVSLTAVAKIAGDTHYFALHHAGTKPDFHLRESFVKFIDC